VLAVSQFLMILATYQNPTGHWSAGFNKKRPDTWHYLWIVLPHSTGWDEDMDEEDPIEPQDDDAQTPQVTAFGW